MRGSPLREDHGGPRGSPARAGSPGSLGGAGGRRRSRALPGVRHDRRRRRREQGKRPAPHGGAAGGRGRRAHRAEPLADGRADAGLAEREAGVRGREQPPRRRAASSLVARSRRAPSAGIGLADVGAVGDAEARRQDQDRLGAARLQKARQAAEIGRTERVEARRCRSARSVAPASRDQAAKRPPAPAPVRAAAASGASSARSCSSPPARLGSVVSTVTPAIEHGARAASLATVAVLPAPGGPVEQQRWAFRLRPSAERLEAKRCG